MSDRQRHRNVREGGEHVYQALVDAGIEVLIGLPGIQTLALDRAVAQREEIQYVMARHETAIPHIAWGYYEASGQPAATLTIPGPGDTNAMHGLKNALNDCVPIIHVVADVDPDDRGKGAIHEIDQDTFDNVVKENIAVTRSVTLGEALERALETALTPPYGPVRLGIPRRILADTVRVPPVSVSPERVTYDNDDAYDRAAELLTAAVRPVVYVGGGARRSPTCPRALRELVTELNVHVLATYKGKGVFPEDDPHFAAVTGADVPEGARRLLSAADVVLGLGTNLDGPSTDHWSLSMGESLVHVNLDPDAIDAAYEAEVPIIDDVGVACKELLSRLRPFDGQTPAWDGAVIATRVRDEYREHLEGLGVLSGEEPARTAAVLRAIRDAVPRETFVTTDVGNFRGWARQVFEAYDPRRFTTAGSWAGMGVGLPAALGAKLANPDDPVVCLTGDGGLLMCLQELHTAAEHGLDVVTVVFNNRDYGSISKSPSIAKYADGARFGWQSPDFVALAEGFDVRASAVSSPSEAATAVEEALGREGPELIEVAIDSEEPSVKAAGTYESTVDLE